MPNKFPISPHAIAQSGKGDAPQWFTYSTWRNCFITAVLLTLANAGWAAICGVQPREPVTVTWSHLTKVDIQAAVADTNCTELWLIKGTHGLKLERQPNITESFPPLLTLTRDISFYGGFTGTETTRVSRTEPVNRDETIISGEGWWRIVYMDGMITNATSINDLTLANGYGKGPNWSLSGGGVFCASTATACSPIFNNVRFTKNGSAGGGGGFYAARFNINAVVRPTFNNVLFDQNTANYGHAVSLADYVSNNTSPNRMKATFNNVTFDKNSSNHQAFSGGTASFEVVGSYNNGTLQRGDMEVEMNSVRFLNNFSHKTAGIVVRSVSSYFSLDPNAPSAPPVGTNRPKVTLNVTNAEFTGNKSNTSMPYGSEEFFTSPAYGSAVVHESRNGGDLVANYTNVTFDSNKAEVISGLPAYGGAITELVDIKESIFETKYDNVTFVNNSAGPLLNTTQSTGDAIYSAYEGLQTDDHAQRIRLNNVTVVGANGSAKAAFTMYQTNVEIRNSIFSQQSVSPFTLGAKSFLLHDSISSLNCADYTLPGSAQPNCVNNYNRLALLGDLADNGGFAKTVLPTPNSPAINAGDASSPSTCLAMDQRGIERPQVGRCDIGAVERKPNISLSVEVSGGTANSVSASASSLLVTGGISTCTSSGGANCTASYDGEAGTPGTITLTAAPATGHSFTGWGNACSAAGINTTANITIDEARSCTASFSINSYTLSGTVSGLNGSGLGLNLNAGGQDESINIVSGSTSFNFATSIPYGENYTISIAAQPSSPAQTCTAINAEGTIAADNVTDVVINCVTNTHPVTLTVLSPFGSIVTDPPLPDYINDSSPLSFMLNVQRGYLLDSIDGCGGTLDTDTMTYAIPPITAACDISLTFSLLEPVPVPALSQYAMALLSLLMLALIAVRLRNQRA